MIDGIDFTDGPQAASAPGTCKPRTAIAAASHFNQLFPDRIEYIRCQTTPDSGLTIH